MSEPQRPASPPPADTQALARTLEAALREALGGPGFPNAEKWRLISVAPKFEMGRHVALCSFAEARRTIDLLVAPTDPKGPAFRRTARFDLIYISADLPRDRQDEIYVRDRALIEAFAGWLASWDPPTAA